LKVGGPTSSNKKLCKQQEAVHILYDAGGGGVKNGLKVLYFACYNYIKGRGGSKVVEKAS